MTFTDADRLAHEPKPTITLANGKKLELHYGFGGLRRIESEFGSIGGLTKELEAGADGKMFETLFKGLLCGLWKTGITETELEANLDPSEIETYADALTTALSLAFPQKAQENAEPLRVVTEAESQHLSTGPEPATSQPQPSDSQSQNSGT